MRLVALATLAVFVAFVPTVQADGPQECVQSLTRDEFCSLEATVEDLDGRDYGAEAGTPGKIRVCMIPDPPNCYAWTPWLPDCVSVTLIVADGRTPVATPCGIPLPQS